MIKTPKMSQFYNGIAYLSQDHATGEQQHVSWKWMKESSR